ncbi:LacI family DNA-binding transcriptional regulator [Paenibacillus sp. MBLB4367]|uniref:LacI family DNA-binding transcriptional regulator n=1 Tax=Paenibacillus sp. MBLB4367 TaxID=3384767 RepID=UPI0039082B8D
MTTRKEVADRAGVSEATVSRVLNNVGPIREETKRKVLEAAKALNYYPSALARSFVRRKSGNLGVVLPYVPKVNVFSTYYFAEVLSGIGGTVRENGYDLLLMFRSPLESMDYAGLFKSQKVDALIILGSRDVPEEREALRLLQEEGHPFCLINQHFIGETFPEIDAEHAQGSLEAVRHLIGQGAKRIAFLNGTLDYSNSVDRLEGVRAAFAEAGMPLDPALMLEGNYSRKSGYAAAAAVYAMRDALDAIFVANDRMAIGLMQGLRELGVNTEALPAIVGYDDSDAARVTDPPLTSVHVPFYEMGKRAAERLIAPVEGSEGANAQREILGTRLVVRKSSGLREK